MSPTALLPHARDHATFANYQDVVSTHLSLNWTIDWTKQLVGGSVRHEMVVVSEEGVKEIVLDVRDLDIKSAELDGESVKYSIGTRHDALGSPLTLTLPKTYPKGSTFNLTIAYSTTSDCTALGWLEASQTKGGKHPYLYSQSQAIHARSLIPCQDTPSIKTTYSASVHSTLPVLLSAIRISPSPEAEIDVGGKSVEYKYEQKVKVASYLIAMAAGNLVYKGISKEGENGATWKTGVWSEPEQIEESHWEFKEDQAKFVATAEKLTGQSYDWGVYDVLVLPPAFPYGGMENACLTFATPTLLTGDRALVDVIAHEISHSWFGNLIGCSSWSHFWLNEGWTTYLERLLVQELQGPAARGLSYIIGAKALKTSLESYVDNPRFQRLVTEYKEGEDPDDAFSTVPYDKGANFLLHLEHTLGGLSTFLPYVRSYVQTFAGRSISTDDWKAHLYSFWSAHGGEEAVKKLDGVKWDEWLHGEGTKLPVDMAPYYDASLADAAYSLASAWLSAGSDPTKLASFSSKDIASFGSSQKVVFLEKVQTDPTPLSEVAVKRLDEVYKLSGGRDAETSLRFYLIALDSGDAYAEQAAVWVQDKGRMKFCRPIFKSLFKVTPDLAKKTFVEHAGFYHPIARKMIAKDLGVKL